MYLLDEIKKCTAGMIRSGLLSVEKRLILLITFSNLISVICGFIFYLLGDIAYTILEESGFSPLNIKLILITTLLTFVLIIVLTIISSKEKEALKIKKDLETNRLNISIENINVDEIVSEFLKGFRK